MHAGSLKYGLYAAIGLVLAAVLLVSVNVLSHNTLNSARIDLTEDKLYTLSEGSLNILAGLDEPVRLRFYFSQKLSNGFPQIRAYAARVREMIEEYAVLANGRIQLEIIDPEPFTEAEDEAVRAGLQAYPVTPTDNLYFGIVGTNLVDDQEEIGFFQQERESFLEYDLTRLIYNLSEPNKPLIGLLTTHQMGADISPMMQFSGRGPQAWAIIQQIRDRFDLKSILPTDRTLPEGLDILLMVHPDGLNTDLKYEIDQFVLKGGKAVVFVDPYSEVAAAFRGQAQQMGGPPAPDQSNLPELMSAWGIEMVAEKVVGDWQAAQQVNAGSRGTVKIVRYLPWLQLDVPNYDVDDVALADIGPVNVATAGSLVAVEGATTNVQPLISTSIESALFDANLFEGPPLPQRLLETFKSDDARKTLAARVFGPAKSAFPDGRPKQSEDASTATDSGDGDAKAEDAEAHVAESTSDINIIVVADTDMLFDQFWVQAQDFFGQRMLVPTASNADFLINMLDNLSGSSDLISLRSRGKSSRPFLVVEGLRRTAEQQFLDEERRLNEKLRETQSRLTELQGSAQAEGGALLDAAQREEINKAQTEILSTRQELRIVQRNLNEDIEVLETKVKFANIGLVAIAVAVVATVLALWRYHRRRRRVVTKLN